jgi:hypothetical protein
MSRDLRGDMRGWLRYALLRGHARATPTYEVRNQQVFAPMQLLLGQNPSTTACGARDEKWSHNGHADPRSRGYCNDLHVPTRTAAVSPPA